MRWYDREVGSVPSKWVIPEMSGPLGSFGPLFLLCVYPGVQRVGCVLCILGMPDGRLINATVKFTNDLSPIWDSVGP